jgi:RNA polymerase sigma-70 factor (ECF subfamily)
MKSISLSAAADGASIASDEQALVRAAQANPSAFAALYQLYVTRVYRYVRAHTASDDDAADLTQQVFLRALDALSAYRERGVPFGAWLFQIAHHAVVDAHRRQRPTLTWDTLPESLQPEGGPNPEGDVLHQEALARLRQLLATLDPTTRELLALRFAAQLSAPEIATVVGKSPAAVKKQLTRILQTLKERYHGA